MDSRVEKLASNIGKLRDESNIQEIEFEIKKNLDMIFNPDASCSKFVYTINTDKLPFGCVVMPDLPTDLTEWLIAGQDVKVTKYSVEIDSKLFDYGFTDEQIVQLILFDIFHLVKDFNPFRKVREAVDKFFARECTQLNIRDSVQFNEILKFGLTDALVKVSSCISLPTDVVSDPFLESLGLENFDETLRRLYREIPGCENEVNRMPKLSMLEWSLRLYNNVDKERLPAVNVLERAKEITASTLYIAKIQNAINALNRIDTTLSVNEAVEHILSESKRNGGFFANLKYSGLRDIEYDLYEYQSRAKNAETEYEVMYALKQINARLAILDDYIRENHDSDPDIDRWINVKMQYIEIRDILAKKKLNKKNYGIFVDYNALDKLDDDSNSNGDY